MMSIAAAMTSLVPQGAGTLSRRKAHSKKRRAYLEVPDREERFLAEVAELQAQDERMKERTQRMSTRLESALNKLRRINNSSTN